MRWLPFILVALAALMLQTTLLQVFWLPTPVGWVGPELLAAVAVFLALNVRSASDAALAGWVLGLALDLTLSGEGMGLLALLYAGGAAGVFHVRRSFFRDKVLSQAVLGLLFCLPVYELWTLYQLLPTGAPAGEYWARSVQAAGVSAYTAVLVPPACGVLKRMQRMLLTGPGFGGRR
jgi:rod shape-determining protein MreD